MNIKLDSLIPFDDLQSDLQHVFSIVEKNGKVILLKNNKPAYVILKHDSYFDDASFRISSNNLKLHEAMKIVLSETGNHTLHASKLADEIFERRLYLKKNGEKAHYTQIRARCGHYPELFQALPGNYIKLIEANEE